MNQSPNPPSQARDAAEVNSHSYELVINQWLEKFETNWEPTGVVLETMARDAGFEHQPLALSELVRVDLDRHYQNGNHVSLEDYFSKFPVLANHEQAATEIAFEDFRARRSRGLGCPASRWSKLPVSTNNPGFDSCQARGPLPMMLARRTNLLWAVCSGSFTWYASLVRGAFSQVFLALKLPWARVMWP